MAGKPTSRRRSAQRPGLRQHHHAVESGFERAPALEMFDLAHDVFDERIRVARCRIVRGHVDFRVIPERARLRQRLVLEHIEARARKRAVAEGAQDVDLDLQAAAPGIDQYRTAERAVARETPEEIVA